MHYGKKVLVLGLVVCLGYLPVADVATLAATRPDSAFAKQQIDQFGVGAKVKIQLADGKKLKGSISAIEDEGFLLASKADGSPQRVAYDQVAQLKLAKLTYKAGGQPDAVEARRVVLGLGVGHHIQVKTTAGKEYHGNIQEIGSDLLTLLPDHQTAPVQIAFADVQYVEQNLSRGAKIAIIVLVVLAVTVTILGETLTE